MMIAIAAVTKGELEAFAAADHAVQSGLLMYEVKSWGIAMRRD